MYEGVFRVYFLCQKWLRLSGEVDECKPLVTDGNRAAFCQGSDTHGLTDCHTVLCRECADTNDVVLCHEVGRCRLTR